MRQCYSLRIFRRLLSGCFVALAGLYPLQVSGAAVATPTDEVATASAGTFTTLVEAVTFNAKELVFDQRSQSYFFPLPASLSEGGDFTLTLGAEMAQGAEGYQLSIKGAEVDADGLITIKNVATNMGCSLLLTGGGQTVATASVTFTFLPIVEVNVDYCYSDTYTRGSMRVTAPDTEGQDTTWTADFRYRGSSALNYDKKSYAVKLRDANGKSADGSFFGLREDNDWILDAMAVDRACMRNRVSTDLWNDFATQPYYQRDGRESKALTGTRGQFVEVMLNGQYHGIYCMTEKMDRKQLKLKKYKEATDTDPYVIRGTLYKSSQWSYEVLMGHEADQNYYPGRAPQAYNNNDGLETWANYEVKYPDYEDEHVDWGPLWRAINFVATSSDAEFDAGVGQYFDMPVVKDYYLFIEVMLASDNHGKNMFFFNYDQTDGSDVQMIGFAPWDLDGTWGRRWDGSSYYTGPQQDFDTFLWAYEHGNHTLFHRLAESTTLEWNTQLAERYAELRQGYFSEESLTQRFRDYADLFAMSGADGREASRWSSYHPDVQGDVGYICEWIGRRLSYLDSQYGYDPLSVSGPTAMACGVNAVGGKGSISISASAPMRVDVYAADGRLCRSVEVVAGTAQVTGLQAGVYLVAGKKVLVQ